MKKLTSVLALSLLLTSCGAPAASQSVTDTASTSTDSTSTDSSMNTSNLSTVTELQIEDEVVGTGEEAKAGDEVKVNYVGTLTDGTQFDSSYDRNQAFEFTLGAGQVIQGWDEGVLGMKVGGKRKLTIPASMAYGASGVPGVIPGGATLVFEVELLHVQ